MFTVFSMILKWNYAECSEIINIRNMSDIIVLVLPNPLKSNQHTCKQSEYHNKKMYFKHLTYLSAV